MIGQEMYMWDRESLGFGDLKAKIDELWFNRTSIKEDLKYQVKLLQKPALTNAELAAKLCYDDMRRYEKI